MARSPNALSINERISKAKERTGRVVGHLSGLFLIHETNRIVVHSPKLSEQIPRSHAAHAFNQLQDSLHFSELLRLTALWDRFGDDRESIPSIVDFIDDPKIINKIAQETHQYFVTQPIAKDLTDEENAEIAKIIQENLEDYKKNRAEKDAALVRERLAEAIKSSRDVQGRLNVRALIDFRHSRLAHNLDPNLPSQIAHFKHGDEVGLLAETVKIADLLHLGINGTSFNWDDARKIARNNAEALWHGCTFNVLR